MKSTLRLSFIFCILLLQMGCSTFSGSNETNNHTVTAPVEDKSLTSTNPYAAIGKKPLTPTSPLPTPPATDPASQQNNIPSLRLEEIKEPSISDNSTSIQQQNISKWIWPTENQIIRRFDASHNETRGLDFTGKVGDAIRAVHSGKVVFSGTGLKGYGQLIIVKHDNNLLTAYAHNHNLLVKEGESVDAGQVISEMGLNEKTGVPMLHFEVRLNGKPVDPINYLPPRF